MVSPVHTWIVLASGKGARILLNDGVGHGIKPVEGAVLTHDPKRDSDVYSDRQGRVHDRVGTARHAAERPTSGAEQDRRAFAGEIAAYLDKYGHKGSFNRLIIIAEPSLLGLIRAALSPSVADRVVAEIAKDLTRAETPALLAALSSHIAV
ncbi:hypothetical protein MNBD_ALPHA09-824 [hydrothermal vent metagenome]|uniref:Host attachment protein n=1 Tax=hydrothermal vent metagenome TaxID=652676 RepID=A0A3B0TLX4_9ZZZZ